MRDRIDSRLGPPLKKLYVTGPMDVVFHFGSAALLAYGLGEPRPKFLIGAATQTNRLGG